ncbi:MAG TPA: T9SS type A sorting domain-containing protein [Bacteroidales bacterium]|nr:T9SS type A sorting domain-containing protein [Bacteroidales bacterium]
MIRQGLSLFVLIIFPLTLSGQEIISGLQINKQVAKPFETHSSKGSDMISLPFFDDFSYSSPVPDQNKWDDQYVFTNNTYSNNQITKGVATFDILDNSGMMYDTPTPLGFAADKLTSSPIDLQLAASSNIRLSFLYEAGGLSDEPEPSDSLTLQFYSPDENNWYSVWRASGKTERGFKNVIIPVDNPRYLKRGFRFRFINYASLAKNTMDQSMIGNCDIWNIDYVLLNAGRNPGDTTYADVAFTLPLRSVLKNYEAMPWKQFKQASLLEMGLYIPVRYRNNDDVTRNVTRTFEIKDIYSDIIVHSFSGYAQDASPESDIDYQANLIYTFESPISDSSLFKITCSLKTSEFDPKGNDTIVYYQTFKNYFAYDDGSSEGGYGINGLGSRNAMFAHRFTSYFNDTIRAIDICFNDSYLNANRRAFNLMIWKDNKGLPGENIYRKEDVIVENGSSINGFYRYYIPEGIPVEGVFYIGWKQQTETFLNAGFDINTPHNGKQYYWLNGAWSQSQTNGTVMIRPVVGQPLITGIEDNVLSREDAIKVWPNPAGDYISVSMANDYLMSRSYISISDFSGHELLRVPYSEIIDISKLHKGIYIISILSNGKRMGNNRFIKSR